MPPSTIISSSSSSSSCLINILIILLLMIMLIYNNNNNNLLNIGKVNVHHRYYHHFGVMAEPEENYHMVECVMPHYFLCENGNCLPESHICDGENDCGDDSDEESSLCGMFCCVVHSPSLSLSLSSSCFFALFISHRYFFQIFCFINSFSLSIYSEEISCNVTTEFKCSSGRCVPKEGRCDRVPQCRDQSDEKDCGNIYIFL